MPLTRHEIRNEYSLGSPDLYSKVSKDDPQGLLEGVATAGLLGIVRQLGDLAEFATEVFHDLHEEVLATAARGHELLLRLQQLEMEFPIIENAMLKESSHLRFVYNAGIEWHPNIDDGQNNFTQGDLPRFIHNSYEGCRGPPRLFLLDKFDGAAGACLKRYTDPSFFRMQWASSELMKAKKERKDKRTRRNQRKSRRKSTGYVQGANIASHIHTRIKDEATEANKKGNSSNLEEPTASFPLPGDKQMQVPPKMLKPEKEGNSSNLEEDTASFSLPGNKQMQVPPRMLKPEKEAISSNLEEATASFPLPGNKKMQVPPRMWKPKKEGNSSNLEEATSSFPLPGNKQMQVPQRMLKPEKEGNVMASLHVPVQFNGHADTSVEASQCLPFESDADKSATVKNDPTGHTESLGLRVVEDVSNQSENYADAVTTVDYQVKEELEMRTVSVRGADVSQLRQGTDGMASRLQSSDLSGEVDHEHSVGNKDNAVSYRPHNIFETPEGTERYLFEDTPHVNFTEEQLSSSEKLAYTDGITSRIQSSGLSREIDHEHSIGNEDTIVHYRPHNKLETQESIESCPEEQELSCPEKLASGDGNHAFMESSSASQLRQVTDGITSRLQSSGLSGEVDHKHGFRNKSNTIHYRPHIKFDIEEQQLSSPDKLAYTDKNPAFLDRGRVSKLRQGTDGITSKRQNYDLSRGIGDEHTIRSEDENHAFLEKGYEEQQLPSPQKLAYTDGNSDSVDKDYVSQLRQGVDGNTSKLQNYDPSTEVDDDHSVRSDNGNNNFLERGSDSQLRHVTHAITSGFQNSDLSRQLDHEHGFRNKDNAVYYDPYSMFDSPHVTYTDEQQLPSPQKLAYTDGNSDFMDKGYVSQLRQGINGITSKLQNYDLSTELDDEHSIRSDNENHSFLEGGYDSQLMHVTHGIISGLQNSGLSIQADHEESAGNQDNVVHYHPDNMLTDSPQKLVYVDGNPDFLDRGYISDELRHEAAGITSELQSSDLSTEVDDKHTIRNEDNVVHYNPHNKMETPESTEDTQNFNFTEELQLSSPEKLAYSYRNRTFLGEFAFGENRSYSSEAGSHSIDGNNVSEPLPDSIASTPIRSAQSSPRAVEILVNLESRHSNHNTETDSISRSGEDLESPGALMLKETEFEHSADVADISKFSETTSSVLSYTNAKQSKIISRETSPPEILESGIQDNRSESSTSSNDMLQANSSDDDNIDGIHVSSSSASISSTMSSPRPLKLATTILMESEALLSLPVSPALSSIHSTDSIKNTALHSLVSETETATFPLDDSHGLSKTQFSDSNSSTSLGHSVNSSSYVDIPTGVPTGEGFSGENAEGMPPPPLPPVEWRTMGQNKDVEFSSSKTMQSSFMPPFPAKLLMKRDKLKPSLNTFLAGMADESKQPSEHSTSAASTPHNSFLRDDESLQPPLSSTRNLPSTHLSQVSWSVTPDRQISTFGSDVTSHLRNRSAEYLNEHLEENVLFSGSTDHNTTLKSEDPNPDNIGKYTSKEKEINSSGQLSNRFSSDGPSGNVLKPDQEDSVMWSETLQLSKGSRVDAVASDDMHMPRKALEYNQSSSTINTEVLQGQIRTGSFNLRRDKLDFPKRFTNINVAAILQKANAIRQAFAGSDDDSNDSDDWSDT